ncbi:MAG: hypothetical protein Q7T55_20020, partial [Solirubrobacteraceae bacterium]|nr:hypothetical protein [Solirubrobacteraceae bacterium]
VATPTPTPVATPTPTPVATPTPTPTPVATPTPTPVATPTPTPVVTPTPTPVVTPSPVATPTPSPVATPTPTPVVTPAPSSAPSVSSVNGFAYGWIGGIALISGKNFSDVKAVKFGSVKATSGFAIGTNQLIVIAPPQNPGSYVVTVETKNGISKEKVTFTYKKLF